MQNGEDQSPIDSLSTTSPIFQGELSLTEIDNCFIKLFPLDAPEALDIEKLQFLMKLI